MAGTCWKALPVRFEKYRLCVTGTCWAALRVERSVTGTCSAPSLMLSCNHYRYYSGMCRAALPIGYRFVLRSNTRMYLAGTCWETLLTVLCRYMLRDIIDGTLPVHIKKHYRYGSSSCVPTDILFVGSISLWILQERIGHAYLAEGWRLGAYTPDCDITGAWDGSA